jgi:hypothetical protein
MEINVSMILQAIYFAIFAHFGAKLLRWLLNYVHQMSVINKMKGMPMLPFIGNAHQLQPRESRNI